MSIKTPVLIHTDINGIDLLFDPVSEFPNTPYQLHYPKTKHGHTEAEDFPIQVGDIAEVGVNGISTETLLAIAIHDISRQNEKNPSRMTSTILGNLIAALNMYEERQRFFAKNNITVNTVFSSELQKKEVLAITQFGNRKIASIK